MKKNLSKDGNAIAGLGRARRLPGHWRRTSRS